MEDGLAGSLFLGRTWSIIFRDLQVLVIDNLSSLYGPNHGKLILMSDTR